MSKNRVDRHEVDFVVNGAFSHFRGLNDKVVVCQCWRFWKTLCQSATQKRSFWTMKWPWSTRLNLSFQTVRLVEWKLYFGYMKLVSYYIFPTGQWMLFPLMSMCDQARRCLWFEEGVQHKYRLQHTCPITDGIGLCSSRSDYYKAPRLLNRWTLGLFPKVYNNRSPCFWFVLFLQV